MKKFILIVVAIMIVAFIGVAIIAESGGNNIREQISSWFDSDEKNLTEKNVDDKKSIEIEDIEAISISDVSENINVIITDEKEVTAHLYGNFFSNKKEAPELVLNKSGDKVTIEIEYDNMFAFFDVSINRLSLDIYLPEEYAGELNLKSVSGNIDLPKTSLEELKASTISGNLDIKEVTAEKIDLDTISGEIEFEGQVEEARVISVSGNLEIHGVTAGYFKTVSGNVKLYVGEEQNFDLKFSTVSGDSDINVPVTLTNTSGNNIEATAGDGEEDIEVKTVSGNFTLN